MVTALQALQEAATANGAVWAVQYLNGSAVCAGGSFNAAEAAALAGANAVVVVVGTSSGEGADRQTLALGGGQDELVLQAASLSPRVAVAVTSPGAVLLTAWADQVAELLLPALRRRHCLSRWGEWGVVARVARLLLFGSCAY